MGKPRIAQRNMISRGKVNSVQANSLTRHSVGLTLWSLSVHMCVWQRRRVTGVNQRGSPCCRAEGEAVMGGEARGKSNYITFPTITWHAVSVYIYVYVCVGAVCEMLFTGHERKSCQRWDFIMMTNTDVLCKWHLKEPTVYNHLLN